VGQALKVNPFAPEVPCHRVISSSLSLGGFQGERTGAAIERKRQLLSSEGVFFAAGLLAEPGRVYCFRKDHS
jgi:methylated-DNA-[protein]-cysteine S-methyltransferase